MLEDLTLHLEFSLSSDMPTISEISEFLFLIELDDYLCLIFYSLLETFFEILETLIRFNFISYSIKFYIESAS